MQKNFNEESDYHTGSEYEQDFDSDNEPPVDKLIEKKMIHKGKNLRVYKRILKFGKRGFERPAAFDKININFGYVDQEIEFIKDLNRDNLKYKELQIGLGELGSEEFFKIAISTMKHQEVAFFEIEKLKFTEHKDRKLDKRVYFVIEVFDWMTIIDFEGDQKIFKVLYNKGSGIHRVEKTDNLKIRISLTDYKFQNFYDKEWEYNTYKFVENEFQEYLKQISFNGKQDIFEYSVTNMKNSDLIILQIDKQQFPKVELQEQQNEFPFYNQDQQAIVKDKVTYKTSDKYYYLIFNLKGLTYFEDVFMDQSVIKEVKNNGYTTAKPEDLSKIFFDFNILVNNEEIYTTFKDRPEPTEDHEQKFYEKNNYFWEYLNEYKFSKALEGTLKFMKKFEECQIEIKNLNKILRGEDLKLIQDYLKKQNIEFTQDNLENNNLNIKYNIKLYYFKEGQNSFTINLEDRKQFIERRKVKAVEFLKNNQYKKSLKLFHKIDNLAEYGVFDEDKQIMLPYRKSALLNISLIHWKMQNWQKMKEFSEKVLALEPQNIKAIYRSAMSLFKQQEHEEALKKLKSFENFKNEKELQSLYKKIRQDFQTFKQKTKQIFSKFKVDNQIQF